MKRFEGKVDCPDIDDVKNIQRLVIANSFENLKFGGSADSVTLSDGATVKANVSTRRLEIALQGKPEPQADVKCAEPVPPLDSVRPFIHQLLLRERHFFTVKTSDKNDWIIVRFALFEPPSVSKQVGKSRDSVKEIL